MRTIASVDLVFSSSSFRICVSQTAMLRCLMTNIKRSWSTSSTAPSRGLEGTLWRARERAVTWGLVGVLLTATEVQEHYPRKISPCLFWNHKWDFHLWKCLFVYTHIILWSEFLWFLHRLAVLYTFHISCCILLSYTHTTNIAIINDLMFLLSMYSCIVVNILSFNSRLNVHKYKCYL